MRLMLLNLLIFGLSTWPVTAITNRLLQNYERRLNSLSGYFDRKRPDGKHRMKRYRCIEEYVDEHGNVIEEGEEHYTTIAPITSRIVETPRSGRQFHNVENMHERSRPKAKGVPIIKPLKLIKVAVIKPTNGAKVTVIRRKLKTKKRKSGRTRRPVPDEDGTGMKRVFPSSTSPSPTTATPSTTSTPSTTTSLPRLTTTELIELFGDESSDDVIMRKFFPEMQLTDDKRSPDRRDDGTSPAATTAAPVERSIPYPSAPLHSMNIASSFADEGQMDDHHMRAAPPSSIRRHEASRYVKTRDDYDSDYDDDYSRADFADYAPYYRMNLRRRARPYPRVLMRSFPPRRPFLKTKVPHISVKRENDRLLMMARDPVTERPRKMDRIALPSANQQTWLPPSPAPLPPPPTAAQPLLSTTVSPQNSTHMEESTPRTCSKMRRLAATFGITDISVYARKNCRFLQTFAPGFTCDQIVHFVDSCHRNRLLE